MTLKKIFFLFLFPTFQEHNSLLQVLFRLMQSDLLDLSDYLKTKL